MSSIRGLVEQLRELCVGGRRPSSRRTALEAALTSAEVSSILHLAEQDGRQVELESRDPAVGAGQIAEQLLEKGSAAADGGRIVCMWGDEAVGRWMSEEGNFAAYKGKLADALPQKLANAAASLIQGDSADDSASMDDEWYELQTKYIRDVRKAAQSIHVTTSALGKSKESGLWGFELTITPEPAKLAKIPKNWKDLRIGGSTGLRAIPWARGSG